MELQSEDNPQATAWKGESVAGAAAMPSIKEKFIVGATGKTDVDAAFHELSAFLFGDWTDLERALRLHFTPMPKEGRFFGVDGGLIWKGGAGRK
jgi:hypothetical protein